MNYLDKVSPKEEKWSYCSRRTCGLSWILLYQSNITYFFHLHAVFLL